MKKILGTLFAAACAAATLAATAQTASAQPYPSKPIRILGEDLTLYRGESGAVQLVAQRCPHRGTQLSAGWVEGDGIRCLYHGWKIDGQGRVSPSR